MRTSDPKQNKQSETAIIIEMMAALMVMIPALDFHHRFSSFHLNLQLQWSWLGIKLEPVKERNNGDSIIWTHHRHHLPKERFRDCCVFLIATNSPFIPTIWKLLVNDSKRKLNGSRQNGSKLILPKAIGRKFLTTKCTLCALTFSHQLFSFH